LKASDVAHERTHVDLGVRLNHIDLIFKVHWTVTFDLQLLGVGLPNQASFAHVYELGEEFVLGGVDHWKGVYGDEDFVTVAVNPHRVIVVFVLVYSRCELDVDVF